MSSLKIDDDASVDQALLGTEVGKTTNEPILSSQELAEECVERLGSSTRERNGKIGDELPC